MLEVEKHQTLFRNNKNVPFPAWSSWRWCTIVLAENKIIKQKNKNYSYF